MPPLLDIGRSMRRSHARRMVLAAIHDLDTAYLAQIAERARTTPQRAHAVLHGKLPGFRPELSLLALELAREGAPTREGTPYSITPRGRLVVKSLQRGGLKLLVEGPLFPEAQPPRGGEARDASRADRCPTCGRAREETEDPAGT